MSLSPDDLAHARSVYLHRLAARRRGRDEDGPVTLWTAAGQPYNVWPDGDVLYRGVLVADVSTGV